jgi:hypothetical protein
MQLIVLLDRRVYNAIAIRGRHSGGGGGFAEAPKECDTYRFEYVSRKFYEKFWGSKITLYPDFLKLIMQ